MATQLFQPPHGSPAWFYACVEKAQAAPIMETVKLTPALAAEILKQNPDNRNVRNTKVMQYAADIKDGRWTFNGEPLIVSREGKLNDGQHRCTAVIDANTPIEVPIIFGIERDTRTTVDQGAARVAADADIKSVIEAESDEEAIIREANAIVLAWNRARQAARDLALEQIDEPVFDRSRAGAFA